MPQSIKRWLWPGLIGFLILIGLIFAFWPRPVAVEMTEISRGSMKVTVEDDGVTRVRDVYVVSAPVNGLLERVSIEAGDPVSANDTVVARLRPVAPTFLDPRTAAERRAALEAARAAEAQAKAEVEHSQSELELAQTEFKRIEQLHDRGFATEAELDRVRTNLRARQSALAVAEATLSQRRYNVEVAQAALMEPGENGGPDLSVVTLKAPVDGRVLRVRVESEQVVAAGTPLLELGNANDLEIVIDFLSRDAVRITEGDPVEIKRWGGPGILNGEVRTVEPFGTLKVSSLGIEEQRVNVIIDITDEPEKWQRLGHGYQLDAAVILWQSDDALKLPLSALFREGEDWATFAVEDGEAVLRLLDIGQINTEYAEVLGGVTAGERVILNPSGDVTDGRSVEALTE